VEDGGHTPFTLALCLLILILVSFTMLWLGDKINRQGVAITRYMATTQAPLTGLLYPDGPAAARGQITVMLYDSAYLHDTGSAWPIPYRDHADWLMRIAGDSQARPKAVFVDLTFGEARPDPTLPQLRDALCELHRQGVPVFLAALPDGTGRLSVHAGLAAAGEDGRPCYTLVGVDAMPDPVDRRSWAYPLTRHWDGRGWAAGPAPAGAPAYRSAAMALAQDVAGIELGPETEPMSLVWGTRPAAGPAAMPCRPDTKGWTRLVPRPLRQLWQDEAERATPLCPFHRTLSMAQVRNLSDEALASAVAGRYVMIGGAVPGHNDFVYSPVHGQLPGVYVHAMALDNLLTYRQTYKQSGEWGLPPPVDLAFAGLIAIVSVFLVRMAFMAVRRRVRASAWVQARFGAWVMDTAQLGRASLGRRLANAPLRLAFWILRLAVQACLAMALIALLQQLFRIGMLPVVELVGMTILAEGLESMEKIRAFVLGAPHEAAAEPLGSRPGPRT